VNYLAHSARPDRGISAQPYCRHIQNVVRDATANAERAAKHSPKYGELLRAAVRLGGEFHDLGKLDDVNQEVLRTNHGKMFNHVDAGVAYLLKNCRSGAGLLAALAVFAHHKGLPEWAKESTRKSGEILRDVAPISDRTPLVERTNQRLDDYRKRHQESVGSLMAQILPEAALPGSPLLWRIALSCLVDADHNDTARNYGDPVADQAPPPLDAVKRLAVLDGYVADLGHDCEDERSRLRAQVYRACRAADTSSGLLACDSPVGSGKTTAIMAHLLRAAAAKGCRRVFVVLPFTNIIDQSVEVYRKALVQSGESTQEVVVAHHHRAEFDDSAARHYSFLWHAPVVVTTAVQFFETLAARMPAALRKLHQLPGSAVFIDEAHAALPANLWPQAWIWLRQLDRDWNCHIVLGSGSLSRFWELPDFVDPPASLPQLVSVDVREGSAAHENRRVTYRSKAESLDLDELARFIKALEGPRLLIVNTVQSAAAIARCLAQHFTRERVEHLSTALTPRDRKNTLELVKLRLRQHDHRNWTLVATSCVEAGVELSFRTGLRERCSLNSLLQTSGRVNRSNEYGQADVWDIQLRHDHLLRPHPAFEASARVLGELFNENKVAPEFCTEALRREITQEGMPTKKYEILVAERNADFPTVEKLFRVISNNTLTAVADAGLIQRLERGEKVSRDELQAGSVQIWQDRAEEWGTTDFQYAIGLKKWTLPYDRFLGFMAGVLPLIDGGQAGFII
jgi:CRISPR-associated endonuclease/helicase Cas3